ncbi:MAG: MerR family transcriptional regulator [Desulfitobacteriaceae bacterium]|nr:MerR family transcriptional regulator [Desulfitobacteriaceae bacterium]MDI6915962.1 MerR family transcriptional regulator [Desulfitobacteriaceae bacterium]
MDKNEGKLLTVGELARKGAVTVRTLQYYDANGLLVPSEYSEGGRRMYGRRDIVRLHQILFLKSLGFSLEEIRTRVLPTESAADLERMFRHQKEVLVDRITHIQEAVNLMDQVIDEIKLGGEISIDRLLAIMGATRLGNPYSFMIRHMGKDQLEYYFNRFENEDLAAEFNNDLKTLTAELIELYQRNEDPGGGEAQKLAARWWDLVMQLTEGDSALLQNMFMVAANDDNWPSDVQDLREATKSFLGKAISTYLENNNLKPPFLEGR